MAGEIGKLFVSIGADLKDFKSGLGQMKKDMKGVSGTIMKNNKAIGGGMALAGAGIVTAGLLSVKTYADMGDEVAKMAKRTGFSTEALSELRHVAEISGTNLNNLEKASRTLSGVIVDAGDGLVTYTRAFERIGVDYKALADMSPEQQFVKVMEALGGVEDETVRAATAADLLGARAGTALLPMMSEGVEVFNELRQEAHDLGIVFDKEAAVKAEEMKDAVLRMERAIQSISIAIAEVLMPALQPLIDIFTGIIKKVQSWMNANLPLKIAIVAFAAALAALLIPLGLMILFLPQIIALTHTKIGAMIASKIAMIASTIATTGLAVATGVLSAAMTLFQIALGPIGIAIMAITAIGILLWKNWDTIANFFKTTVVDAFKKVWEFLKEWGILILGIIFPPALIVGAILKWKDEIVGALSTAWDAVWSFIKEWGVLILGIIFPPALIIGAILKWKEYIFNGLRVVWDAIWGFLKDWGLILLGLIFPPALIVGVILKWKAEILGVLKKVWDAIVYIAKAPFNAIIALFNKVAGFFSGKVLFSFKLPSWIPGIGGKGFTLKLPTIPKIPSLDYRGVVPGPRGSPILVMARGGEEFMGTGGRVAGGAPVGDIHIHTLAFVGDRAGAKKLWDLLRDEARRDQRTMLGAAES